jgi:DNA-binding NtrC family response regulator
MVRNESWWYVSHQPPVTTLLTWTDRAGGRVPDHHGPRPASDRGPILRLVDQRERDYTRIVVLCMPRSRAVTDALADELRGERAAARVELLELPVDDPSDYAQLFAALGEALHELAPLGRCDVLLSAGTPQMQTLWVILVEAGLLAARMLQVIPAAFVPDPHPSPIREVRLDIEGFPEIRAMREELVRLRAETRVRRSGRIGNSEAMRVLERRLARVARTQVPVLITGETGTGKELIARALHDASERAGGPFVAENCGSFSEGVLSSELFGHERGAFTGASGRRRGLFEQADRGTLFLDEIGETSPRVQVMLLRVLQEGRLRRVGGEDEVAVDVRVVAATHRDLRVEVEQGRFREDLYYRLCGAQLELPPLRERGRDLELLVRHFLAELGVPSLWPSEAAWAALRAHRWPGNVRELRAEVVRWSVFCERSVELDDLSPPIRAAFDVGEGEGATRPREPSLAAGAVAASGPIRPLAEQVDATERRALLAALAACEGNLSAIARALAIDRNTLKRKLDKHGLRSVGP